MLAFDELDYLFEIPDEHWTHPKSSPPQDNSGCGCAFLIIILILCSCIMCSGRY